MSCPALQLENQIKQKRPRFSEKHKDEGSRLARLLREKRKEFPTYRFQLDELIHSVTTHSERTRKSDRDRVLSALREWEFGLTRTELVEDTGLSDWDIRKILEDLLKSERIVKVNELRAGTRSKQWCIAYKLHK